MVITPEELQRVKDQAEELYKKIGEVSCPYFKEVVAFNTKGLDHIKFKDWNKTRLIEDQYRRLKLLYLAPVIIHASHTLQEFREQSHFERQKINSRWENRMVRVNYFGFVAIVDEVRVKIVVKQIKGGNKFFWSIYPHWKTKMVNGAPKKILHDGDMETQ